MQKVTFYTKLKCHLCEEAYLMLLEFTSDLPMEIDIVDITHAHHKASLAAYSDRIPVVAKAGASMELNWPFTPEQLWAYLTAEEDGS